MGSGESNDSLLRVMVTGDEAQVRLTMLVKTVWRQRGRAGAGVTPKACAKYPLPFRNLKERDWLRCTILPIN